MQITMAKREFIHKFFMLFQETQPTQNQETKTNHFVFLTDHVFNLTILKLSKLLQNLVKITLLYILTNLAKYNIFSQMDFLILKFCF